MRRQDYLTTEYGWRWADKRNARLRVALIFPNLYRLGMSNLGFQLIWQAAHRHPGVAAERLFLPDRDQPGPPVSLETGRSLPDFDILAFSISYEQDYLNVLRLLDSGGVPRRWADRTAAQPFLLAGGPALWSNPEPMAPFFDAVVIGEGESIIGEILEGLLAQGGADQLSWRETLAQIKGVYVPALYTPRYSAEGGFAVLEPGGKAPVTIQRRWEKDIAVHPAESAVLTPHTEFADTYLIEVARGCARACRFCLAGFVLRPVRYRPLAQLLEQVERGLALTNKIGLLAAAVSDYPELPALSEHLCQRTLQVYLSSIRADAITPELIRLLRHGGQRSLTMAPEAGSEQLRRRINKQLSHSVLLEGVRCAAAGGLTGIKVYVMIGLPQETTEDVLAIADLLADMIKVGRPLGMQRFVVDLHPFVPKALTPYQWERPASLERFAQIFDLLKRPLAQLGVQCRFDSPAWAVIQELLARGDRRTADILETALAGGGNLSAYRRAMRERGFHRNFVPGAPTPWDHIASGIDPRFLLQEAKRALLGQQSPPCPIVAPSPGITHNCRRCGVC
ncbi:MAG: radical SAM protein [Cyanobacteria bacterium NC_groundwater_1444_Ag_S-0.65um_54_12]|nr:radical SAM protein [Cyanobacteria bacterium NC_groundwater_1444_Ag_S-0.65um_54_12]